MAKAILVLGEMPKRCGDCWLANFQREDCYCYCMGLQKPINYNKPYYEEMDTEGGDWRWNKCPLREFPEESGRDQLADRLIVLLGQLDHVSNKLDELISEISYPEMED